MPGSGVGAGVSGLTVGVGSGVGVGLGGQVMQGSFIDGVGTGLAAGAAVGFLRHATLVGMLSVSCSAVFVQAVHGVAAMAVCGRMPPVRANAAHTVKPMIFPFIMVVTILSMATIPQSAAQGNPLFTDSPGLFPNNACNLSRAK